MDPPVAIVTGASSGIGAAVARRLARAGWRLTINYHRNRDGAESVAAECESLGTETVVVQGSVADDDACRKLASTTATRWQRIDALINNAGTTRFCPPDDLAGLSRQDFEAVFAVNVVGPFQMVRACASLLRRSDRGAITNVSSHSGFSGLGSSIAYAASKAALNNMTLALARAMAPDVRVNAVCPGFVDTDWVRGRPDSPDYEVFKSRIGAMTPLGRITSPDEVAESVFYLTCSGAAITGELLIVDGGNHLTINEPDLAG